jgi:hypothetical protein
MYYGNLMNRAQKEADRLLAENSTLFDLPEHNGIMSK